ncbi:MAG: sodium:solute symporter family protein, partial [Gammaproteobacteria bacterium]
MSTPHAAQFHATKKASWALPTAVFVLMFAVAIAISLARGQQILWGGLILMMFFYALTFYVGFRAAGITGDSLEQMIVADRSLPLWIGAFTMAATWIDGGYLNGTTEYTYSQGLVWVQAPWCYALSLIIGGIVFAPVMRRHEFMTMLDPLERRYGKRVTACLYLTSLTGDVFWSAAILTALGTTFGTILGMDFTTSIVLSAAISIAYTMAGGMWSVAFTNVLQLAIIFVGLFAVLFFVFPDFRALTDALHAYRAALADKASLFPALTAWKDPSWGNHYWAWWERTFVLTLGGIPWQGYFQRVLSARNERTASWLSIIAGCLCLLVAVPPILLGIAAYSANWKAFGAAPPEHPSMVLPYVLRYMTPPLVAAVGLGAVSAAVMSSVASSILSSASMAAWNVYRPLVRPAAEKGELLKVVKRSVLVIGVAATLIALNVRSVYALWYLCADLVYCILFPQLTTALFFKRANT